MFRPIAAIFRLLQFCTKSIIYIYTPILQGDAEISASPRNIGIYIYIYMILFEQNCNNLKMAAIGRNM